MKQHFEKQPSGFTLIELLVVIAIIGLLSSVVFASLNSARAKARDAIRLAEMQQVIRALELYYDDNGSYPVNTDNDNGGWDTGCVNASDPFIQPLVSGGYLPATICDPSIQTTGGGYAYYLYPTGNSGCSTARGAFYVLGVRTMETSGRPHPSSPGWSCPSRNWQNEFDWVTGNFER